MVTLDEPARVSRRRARGECSNGRRLRQSKEYRSSGSETQRGPLALSATSRWCQDRPVSTWLRGVPVVFPRTNPPPADWPRAKSRGDARESSPDSVQFSGLRPRFPVQLVGRRQNGGQAGARWVMGTAQIIADHVRRSGRCARAAPLAWSWCGSLRVKWATLLPRMR